MSAEYAARMEVLQRRREELTAQRQAVEKRIALREATAAEFSAVALQSCKQKWKTQRSAAISAKKRNDEFVRSLHEAQRQVHDSWSRLQGDQSSRGALLTQEKARYNRKVEQVFPAWQEQLQRQRVQKLRELEDKKRAVERRRYLAKKSFEKEQTLDDLIRKTRHEVEMAENLEQNEVYERELLRTQSTNQAKEVGQSIREVALEARSYLQQQAVKHLEVLPQLDEELAEKLSETFSPRNTLRALREGSSSLAFEENQQNEEEKPARQIRVEIPARMNTPTRSYYPDERQQELGQEYSYETFEDDFIDDTPRQFSERSVEFNPATSEWYQTATTATTGNDCTDFNHNIYRDLPSLMQQNQVPRLVSSKLAPRSGSTLSQIAPYSGPNQQNVVSSNLFVHNESREEVIILPRDRLEVLPTLVTGKLDSIPEANEQTTSAGTSLMVPDNMRVGGSELEKKSDGERAVAKTSVSIASITAANSWMSPHGPPMNTTPVKAEENQVTSSAASAAVATAVYDTQYSRVDADQPPEHQGNSVLPETLRKETVPTTSVPESNESSASSESKIERDVQVSAQTSVQESQGKRAKDAQAEAPLHNAISSVNERDDLSLRVDDMSVTKQADSELNISMLNNSTLENPLEAKAIFADSVDINQLMDIEPPPSSPMNEIVDDYAREQSLNHDNSTKTDSFHGAQLTIDTMGSSLSLSDTFVSDTTEARIPEPKASCTEEVLTDEHPSVSTPYKIDLLEPLSPPAPKSTNVQASEDDMLLTSMQSDDFDVSVNMTQPVNEAKPSMVNDAPAQETAAVVVDSNDSHSSLSNPPSSTAEAVIAASITEKLSQVDRVKALGALISRVEEGATEGDTLGGSTDTGSSNDSKRELIKMAVGGRKAQIAFFGSDICFELILDISRDLGPVLFPPKAFEGIMNDQKIRKLHQSNKEKQLDLWKALSSLMKQLVQLKAMPSATLVDLFVLAFLAHDPDNQRSQRKLREFLVTVCGGGGSKPPSPRKEASATSPPPSPPKQDPRAPSPETVRPATFDDKIGTPQLLQTAFLQRQSPPKPKVFGIASSSFKDRSSGSSDVLMSMNSGPMKLSQKLLRGGKMNDYSEFEEEEEVDLQNLIGSRPAFASRSSSQSHQATRTSPTSKSSTAKQAAAEEDDDEFDADF